MFVVIYMLYNVLIKDIRGFIPQKEVSLFNV